MTRGTDINTENNSVVGPGQGSTLKFSGPLPNAVSTVIGLLVVTGYAAGPKYNYGGSGSNFLCLPDDPQWKTYIDGNQDVVGAIYGVEYQLYDSGIYRNNIFSESNNDGNALLNNPAPCAVCYVAGR